MLARSRNVDVTLAGRSISASREITQVEYRQLIVRIREIVTATVQPGARVLVVSRGDDELLRFDNCVAWHFPRAEDGSYAGYHPAGSEEAIEHLKSLCEGGGQYLVVPAPSFWWLEQYPELFAYLAQNAAVVWNGDSCLIYRHHPRAGAVSAFGSIDDTACGVDVFGATDDAAFYLQGWMRDSEGAATTRLTAVSPAGERIELLERLFRYARPGVEQLGDLRAAPGNGKSGFIVHFETETACRRRAGWILEMRNEAGSTHQFPAPLLVLDIATVRGMILERLPSSALPDERLMAGQVFPAIDRLQKRARRLVRIADTTDYGKLDRPPEISIVIPLYSNIDLVEHQIAEFVHDPEVRAAELVYVLDSPELRDWFAERASDVFRMYRVPFRVVFMERPSGFAAATNAGASVAAGRLLLLMNSDVLPDEPGWLGEMQRFYLSKDRIGALGPKLLYEDGSLQHAGLYFEMVNDRPFAGVWANMHYFKGFSRHFPAANLARPVPAVTAACMMIEAGLFRDAGGLTDVYVQGDFEDSDLCLRLIERGRENWYLPDAELYHLEGQSYDEARRQAQALYNRWLHTRRCGELIEALASRA